MTEGVLTEHIDPQRGVSCSAYVITNLALLQGDARKFH